ncbi:RibD family protein [Streptosporangium sp. NPDC002721]|uniref:RibD family protein n=1 Tax=Streptosporangium sp. NPDC002721 TaxID=3366188 RepID=UPI0036C5008A
MNERPYVLLSVAMSIDGYIDDTTPDRLLLSNAEDFDRVDEVRAGCDAILIGANTIRRDNPRLLVNSEERRIERERRGLPPYPAKVTITSGGLDSRFKFFHTGGEKLVYSSTGAVEKIREELGDLATVIDVGDPVSLSTMLVDMGSRGIRRLMIEGGGTIHTQFLTQGLADEIHLAIAPFFVGDSNAPKFVHDGVFPQDATHRMDVAEVKKIGDIVLVRYLARGTV